MTELQAQARYGAEAETITLSFCKALTSAGLSVYYDAKAVQIYPPDHLKLTLPMTGIFYVPSASSVFLKELFNLQMHFTWDL